MGGRKPGGTVAPGEVVANEDFEAAEATEGRRVQTVPAGMGAKSKGKGKGAQHGGPDGDNVDGPELPYGRMRNGAFALRHEAFDELRWGTYQQGGGQAWGPQGALNMEGGPGRELEPHPMAGTGAGASHGEGQTQAGTPGQHSVGFAAPTADALARHSSQQERRQQAREQEQDEQAPPDPAPVVPASRRVPPALLRYLPRGHDAGMPHPKQYYPVNPLARAAELRPTDPHRLPPTLFSLVASLCRCGKGRGELCERGVLDALLDRFCLCTGSEERDEAVRGEIALALARLAGREFPTWGASSERIVGAVRQVPSWEEAPWLLGRRYGGVVDDTALDRGLKAKQQEAQAAARMAWRRQAAGATGGKGPATMTEIARDAAREAAVRAYCDAMEKGGR